MNREPIGGHEVSAARTDARASARSEGGQSLVEFSLILTPLLMILLGIIQFGLIFNAQVTITNAAREGARAGTIYRAIDPERSVNDLERNNVVLAAIKASFGILSSSGPQFSTTGTWASSGSAPDLTYTNGDIVIAYTKPVSVTDSSGRAGEQMKVTITYHQDLIVPLIANLLPRDGGGRLAQGATVTMVIN